MFKQEFKKSIRYKFLKDISIILFVGTCLTSAVIGNNVATMLADSLTSKGMGLASNIAKRNENALIMSGNIQLTSVYSELITDEEIIYTVIRNNEGNILTTQFESINYKWPGLKNILPGLSKDSELQDILASIKNRVAVKEVSVPIRLGVDTLGNVTIGMSEHKIRAQALKTVLFIVALNFLVMFVLGLVLFITSKKTILDPIIELGHSVARFAKGDLSAGVTIKSSGEIQMLVNSFNQMAKDFEKTTVSRDYVDNIIRNMMDMLIVVSPDGTIRTVNYATCALLGYQEEELIGQPISIVFADDNGSAGKKSDAVIKNILLKNVEYTYVTKDGRHIPVLFSSSGINAGDGTAQGLICLAVDITDRKRAEDKLKDYARELQENNEELKSFAYIASHDLRTPLVNMKGFAGELRFALQDVNEVINDALPSLSENNRTQLVTAFLKDVPEALGFIESSTRRMDELISAIAKLSRLGRQELKPELFKVREVVQVTLNDLHLTIEKNGIKVHMGTLPEIVADKNALQVIFSNILENAVKYVRPGVPGEIEITAEKGTAETTFAIRDNGRGIPAEDIQKVFEMFRQVGEQDKAGEGMGLAYTKILVRRHGGHIWCESTVGVGSTIYFTIPEKGKNSGPA